MNIVGVSACPVGIAHTYMTKKYITKYNLIKAAIACGHQCRIETQGSVGVEDELSAEEVKQADVVILACDVKISGEERFKGIPMIRTSTSAVLKDPVGFIKKVEKALSKHQKG